MDRGRVLKPQRSRRRPGSAGDEKEVDERIDKTRERMMAEIRHAGVHDISTKVENVTIDVGCERFAPVGRMRMLW